MPSILEPTGETTLNDLIQDPTLVDQPIGVFLNDELSSKWNESYKTSHC